MVLCVLCLATLCGSIVISLCDLMDCSSSGSSVYGDSPGNNTQVGCHALLQGILPTQVSNTGLLHGRWILHQLRYQGSPSQLYFSFKKSIVFIYANDEYPKTEIKKAILYKVDQKEQNI